MANENGVILFFDGSNPEVEKAYQEVAKDAERLSCENKKLKEFQESNLKSLPLNLLLDVYSATGSAIEVLIWALFEKKISIFKNEEITNEMLAKVFNLSSRQIATYKKRLICRGLLEPNNPQDKRTNNYEAKLPKNWKR